MKKGKRIWKGINTEQVASLLSQGKSISEVAKQLGITKSTVTYHRNKARKASQQKQKKLSALAKARSAKRVQSKRFSEMLAKQKPKASAKEPGDLTLQDVPKLPEEERILAAMQIGEVLDGWWKSKTLGAKLDIYLNEAMGRIDERT